GMKNQPSVIASKVDCVEKTFKGWAKLPSDPGPFSEDVSMNDFVPRTRLGPILFLISRESGSGEVSVYFQFLSSGVDSLLLNSGAW
ncbi:MAG: hypothetical protein ACK56I_03760, partial [bacterium]